MLMLATALLIQQRGWRTIWLGGNLGFAYIDRPTNAVPLAATAAWVLICRRRDMREFLLGVAAVLVPFLAANLAVYDHPLPPYYRPSFVGGHNRYALEALLGNLISPSRGLLVYSPIFAFSLAGFVIA